MTPTASRSHVLGNHPAKNSNRITKGIAWLCEGLRTGTGIWTYKALLPWPFGRHVAGQSTRLHTPPCRLRKLLALPPICLLPPYPVPKRHSCAEPCRVPSSEHGHPANCGLLECRTSRHVSQQCWCNAECKGMFSFECRIRQKNYILMSILNSSCIRIYYCEHSKKYHSNQAFS